MNTRQINFAGPVVNFGVKLSQWQSVRKGSGPADKLYVTAVNPKKTPAVENWIAKKQSDGTYTLFREDEELAHGVKSEMEARRTFQMLADDQGYKLTRLRVLKSEEFNYLDFTYYLQEHDDGTFSTGYQWDSGSGWFDERRGFKRRQDAVVYIKGRINEENNRNKEVYDADRGKK